MFYMSLSTHFAWSKDERIYAAIVILGLSFGKEPRLEWGHFPQNVELFKVETCFRRPSRWK